MDISVAYSGLSGVVLRLSCFACAVECSAVA
jgi:hypothetical protein